MAERSTNVVRRPRRKRDPEGTREAILEAARGVLAQDGKEGLSVAQVAVVAGVNRGTAYHHFQTREQLIEATAAWVAEKLNQAAFEGKADITKLSFHAYVYCSCQYVLLDAGSAIARNSVNSWLRPTTAR